MIKLKSKRGLIPISQPSINFWDLVAVLKPILSKRLTQGGVTREFEAVFASYLGVEDAVAVNSGTSALILALTALKIGQGDQVIVPNFTFVAPANAVKLVGAETVLVDVNPETYNLHYDKLKDAVTNKTKAIIVVHLFGLSADMNPIMKFAKENNLLVIEDVAQSLGGEYEGRKLGAFGDISCFSFYPTKTITTGEGGMVVAKEKKILDIIKQLRNQGMTNKYNYILPGYNFRLTEFQSAIGLSQIKRISKFIAKRRKIARLYCSGLNDIFGIPSEPLNCTHVYNQFTVKIPARLRDEFVKSINAVGIAAEVYYPKTLDEYPLFSNSLCFLNGNFSSKEVVSLPIYPSLSKKRVRKIILESNRILMNLLSQKS